MAALDSCRHCVFSRLLSKWEVGCDSKTSFPKRYSTSKSLTGHTYVLSPPLNPSLTNRNEIIMNGLDDSSPEEGLVLLSLSTLLSA